jgi:hypothetical protein
MRDHVHIAEKPFNPERLRPKLLLKTKHSSGKPASFSSLPSSLCLQLFSSSGFRYIRQAIHKDDFISRTTRLRGSSVVKKTYKLGSAILLEIEPSQLAEFNAH